MREGKGLKMKTKKRSQEEQLREGCRAKQSK